MAFYRFGRRKGHTRLIVNTGPKIFCFCFSEEIIELREH